MAILIDPPLWPAHGRLWSHLVSDTSFEELHSFAAANGVPERGFEGDHYDVPQERHAALVAAGAHPVSARELLERLRAAGLRRPKRRGERVLASTDEDGSRVDVLHSTLPPTWPVRAVRLLVGAPDAVLAVPAPGGGWVLPRAAVTRPSTVTGAADRLLGALVHAVPDTPAGPEGWHQVGYLRTGSGRATEIELILRCDVGRDAVPPARRVVLAEIVRATPHLGPLLGTLPGPPGGW